MKKTITLLLAAASVAVGATPMNLTWENNTTTLGDNVTAITAVFTLDLTAISTNGAIFSFIPTGGVTQYGIIGEPDYYGYYMYDVTPGSLNDGSILNLWGGSGDDNAIIAYTYDKNVGASIQLTIFDSQGNSVYSPKPQKLEVESLDFTSIASLTKSSAVGLIDIYDTALEGDEITAAIEYLKNPTIQPDTPGGDNNQPTPEPTTTTLSLLALAGLAARRRRK